MTNTMKAEYTRMLATLKKSVAEPKASASFKRSMQETIANLEKGIEEMED